MPKWMKVGCGVAMALVVLFCLTSVVLERLFGDGPSCQLALVNPTGQPVTFRVENARRADEKVVEPRHTGFLTFPQGSLTVETSRGATQLWKSPAFSCVSLGYHVVDATGAQAYAAIEAARLYDNALGVDDAAARGKLVQQLYPAGKPFLFKPTYGAETVLPFQALPEKKGLMEGVWVLMPLPGDVHDGAALKLAIAEYLQRLPKP